MLSKWEKIEKLINKILEKFRAFLIATYFKVLPPVVLKKYQLAKAWIIKKITDSIQRTRSFVEAQKSLKEQRKELLQKKIAKTKEIFQNIVLKLKSIKNWKPKPPTKQDFKDLWQAIKQLPKLFWKALWFVKEDQKPFVATALAILVPGIIVIGFLSVGLLKDAGYFREPAAVVREYKKIRPEYYHQYDRVMKIHSVNFPVYVESVRGARMVRMDLTLTTTNKYTRNYLNNNYHLVQDRLNSRLEPMIPEFPIEEEGKKIIKDKVKEEIDSLIKELKIDGAVQAIHIHSILSG